MAEKVESKKVEKPKNVEDKTEDVIEDDVEETETVTEQDKTEKRFTQADLERKIQTRLAREKEKVRAAEEQVATYEEQISQYEEILKKQVEEKSKDIPESYRKILSKLSVLEQLDFLSDDSNVPAPKKQIPSTPKPASQENKTVRKPSARI